jgi:hypothetical protein
VVVLKLDVSRLQAVESILNNRHCSFYDQLSRVDLGLGLLNLEQTLGHFSMVGNLHEVHTFDHNSGDLASVLQHGAQMFGDDRGIVK